MRSSYVYLITFLISIRTAERRDVVYFLRRFQTIEFNAKFVAEINLIIISYIRTRYMIRIMNYNADRIASRHNERIEYSELSVIRQISEQRTAALTKTSNWWRFTQNTFVLKNIYLFYKNVAKYYRAKCINLF